MGRCSSGVVFENAGPAHWEIAGVSYDLRDFLAVHPGGEDVLLLARDRFGDATTPFLAHHTDVPRALAALQRYRISPSTTPHDARVSAPFHAELRRRLHRALGRHQGPSHACILYFCFTIFGWAVCWWQMYGTGSLRWAAAAGVFSAWLGAFGHNFVHQTPRWYRAARVSFDLIGLSGTVWRREHVLQHHMYTNTELDNHYRGTEPFLVVDPRRRRNFMQRVVFPRAAPLLLLFGIPANFVARVVAVLRGEESISTGEVVWPVQLLLLWHRHAQWGLCVALAQVGVAGVFYFSVALCNHNALDAPFAKKGAAERADWAEWQVRTCADFHTGASLFVSIFFFLGLNRHTVHHVFPRLDVAHHARAQQILESVCADFRVPYRAARTLRSLYWESIQTFGGARHELRWGQQEELVGTHHLPHARLAHA